MDYKLLNEKIELSHIPKSTIAETLGITRQGLYNKLTGEKEFKGSEIKRLSLMLGLSPKERDAIFFADFVDETSTNPAN